jgi:hypothetical protein
MADYPSHPVIDVWAVLADPDIPAEVGRRLLKRQSAARNGRAPGTAPEGDKPFLARHVVLNCATHDEIVRRSGEEWAHLSDGVPCPPEALPDIPSL